VAWGGGGGVEVGVAGGREGREGRGVYLFGIATRATFATLATSYRPDPTGLNLNNRPFRLSVPT